MARVTAIVMLKVPPMDLLQMKDPVTFQITLIMILPNSRSSVLGPKGAIYNVIHILPIWLNKFCNSKKLVGEQIEIEKKKHSTENLETQHGLLYLGMHA